LQRYIFITLSKDKIYFLYTNTEKWLILVFFVTILLEKFTQDDAV